jgi:type II secretory pathway pseudopilin PulG
MIELIVVVVVLAVLAGIAVPRMLAGDNRRAQAEAESVAMLLTQAARRQMLTTSRIAAEYDADFGAFKIMVLKPGDAANFDGRDRVWTQDPLLNSVPLASLEVVTATSNAASLDPRRFHAELSDAGGRVALALLLRDPSTGSEWTVRLPLAGDRALLIAGRDQRDPQLDPDTIDLDDAGRRDSPW